MDCFCTLKYCVQNPLVVTNTNNPRPHHPSHVIWDFICSSQMGLKRSRTKKRKAHIKTRRIVHTNS
ncbi:unnamed protein product [Brassica oleracea var. botrytis]|uniref:Uncharacterized protein n=2 Tax=Brassica TaxID=3705 RepID=A0A3P6DS49_BRAOL|nr:unnamed protein product [Brassica oleracea]